MKRVTGIGGIFFKAKDQGKLREALLSAIGIWKDRTDLPDTETYVRNLRNDKRLKRIFK